MAKHWCKICSTFVIDSKFERKQHELSVKHKSNLRRQLNELRKNNRISQEVDTQEKLALNHIERQLDIKDAENSFPNKSLTAGQATSQQASVIVQISDPTPDKKPLRANKRPRPLSRWEITEKTLQPALDLEDLEARVNDGRGKFESGEDETVEQTNKKKQREQKPLYPAKQKNDEYQEHRMKIKETKVGETATIMGNEFKKTPGSLFKKRKRK